MKYQQEHRSAALRSLIHRVVTRSDFTSNDKNVLVFPSIEAALEKLETLTDHVIVAGGGPAGALAACLLARAGARVTVFERGRFPRPKLCGDTLNPGAVALLQRHFDLGPLEASSTPIDGMLLSAPGPVFVRGEYGAGVQGLGVTREVFDAWLIAHAVDAGARLVEDATVTGPALDERGQVSGVRVRHRWRRRDRRRRRSSAHRHHRRAKPVEIPQDRFKYDIFGFEGNAPTVKKLQDFREPVHCGILCDALLRFCFELEMKDIAEMYRLVVGWEDISPPELTQLAERIYTLTRCYNVREGIRRKDDTLPPRILYDPLPDGPGQGKVMGDKTFNKMLDEYYALRGWDSNGIPLPETLQRLGLTEIVGDLPE